jgi:1-acyl-sn-glycerol-3-phosphate acyltransferase
MADRPADPPSTVLRSLAQVNREPGRGTIFVVVSLLNLLIRPLTRRDWRGQDKIPQTGGVIVVANHISNADPLALGQFLAFSGRWPRFLAKASLFRYPVLGHILRACGQIPVQRQSARSADALLAAVEAVGQGRAVVIYPEGTISYDPDLWPMKGKTGAARIALRTGCPVIPIGQWGAQELMYGRRIHFPKLFPRKTLRLIAGDPVQLDDLRQVPVTRAVLDAATTRIMDAITSLVAELRQQPPPDQRYDSQRATSAREDEP